MNQTHLMIAFICLFPLWAYILARLMTSAYFRSKFDYVRMLINKQINKEEDNK